jgi:hypothetical protein
MLNTDDGVSAVTTTTDKMTMGLNTRLQTRCLTCLGPLVHFFLLFSFN